MTSADSKLVRAFRAVTKAPAKRKTSNPSEFPETQRASPKQKVNILTLAKVALSEFPHFYSFEFSVVLSFWACVIQPSINVLGSLNSSNYHKLLAHISGKFLY